MTGGLDALLRAARGKRLIVFDMDNTLMDETAWLYAGYAAVARMAAGGDDQLSGTLSEWLMREFQKSGREKLFDRMAVSFPSVSGTLSDWLERLRTVEISLPMNSWVSSFCGELPDTALAILTNGNAVQQRNKYRQMEPARLRDRMRLYCAAETEPKPSPAGLLKILEDHQCPPEEALFIGDSASDSKCAGAAGVEFVTAPSSAVYE
jgi:FMN phosphatase YigB (HAD superfamily)